MVATQFTGSERRALRWMRRRGLGLRPSEAAFELLTARLDVRFRAGAVMWSLFILFFVFWQLTTSPADLDAASPWRQAVRTVVPVVVFGLAFAGFATRCSHVDRRIARSMPTRVTRTGAVAARVVLGPVAVWCFAAVAALEVTVVLLLVTRLAGPAALAFGGSLLIVWLVCLSVLRIVLHRPTVALDVSALAVDERLRAFDALFALVPTGWAALALVSPLDLRGVHGAGLVVTLAGAALVVSIASTFSHPAERVRYSFGRTRGRA